MNSPTYRIKPLVWVKCAGGYYANCQGGWYVICHNETNDHCAWRWRDSHDRHTKSIEAAKAACEQHYRERLMEGLEVVE